MARGNNKPITHAEVKELGEGENPRVYAHKEPNRRYRRWAEKVGESGDKYGHNNRKATKSRKTQRVELEKAIITPEKRVITIKTGVIRSIRIIRNYLIGGNTVRRQ